MFKLLFLLLPSHPLYELSKTTSWFHVWFNSEALGRQGEEGEGQGAEADWEKQVLKNLLHCTESNASTVLPIMHPAEPSAVH